MAFELNKQLQDKFKTHKARGLTQAELAVSVLHVNVSTVGNWMRDVHEITGLGYRAPVHEYVAGKRDGAVDAILEAKKGGSA